MMGRPNLDYNNMTDEEILEIFKNNYYKIQPNDATEYIKKCNVPSLYILKTKLNLKWNDALIKIGIKKEDLKFDRSRNYIKIYNEMIDEMGYIPSIIEFRKYLKENKITDITGGIIKKYGTYNKFLNEYGLEINGTTPTIVKETNEELLKIYKDFCKKLGRVAKTTDLNESEEIYNSSIFSIRFGGFNNLRRIAGYEEYERVKKRYSKIKITNILKEEYVKLARRLTVDEINKVKELPNQATILKYFKTTKISDVWEEVEQEMIKDHIKLLKNNKI